MTKKMRWQVEALHGYDTTQHSNLDDAMQTAKRSSDITGDEYIIRNLTDGRWYMFYQYGRKVIDNWHI